MPPLDPIRAKLRELMLATLADEKAHHTWTYFKVRPLAVPPAWRPGQRVKSDCSKGVQFLCRWAGAPDPMNMGYGLYGNSSTLASHLPHRASASELEIGDPVTFGHDGDEHAAMVLEPGHDPLLWSDGHQGAPNTYRLSHDRREAQFLRLILPKHVPTERETLRSLTGYWAWVQWRLGEGDWRGYQPRDKTVRPNVPRAISPDWLRRFAKYNLRRKKPNPANGPALA